MADHRRDMRDKVKKASWDNKKIDCSKTEEEEKPKFDKNAYEELMAYAKELKEKQNKNSK